MTDTRVYKTNMSAAELILALGDLDGPSRPLDDRIWRWVNEQKLNPAAPGWQYDLLEPPAYTQSVDAALTLLPILNAEGERADYILEHVNGGLTISAQVGHNDPDKRTWGENAAIALTRGALELHVEIAA